jgi:hypothetical protein
MGNMMKWLILLVLLCAVSASAQINTGIGFDTSATPDGVVDKRLFPLSFTSDGTITFSIAGRQVTLSSSAAGGIYVDTSGDGTYDTLISPAYLREGNHVRFYISSGYLVIDGGSDADSVMDIPIGSTAGIDEGYTLSYDTATASFQVEPVSAGNAFFFRDMPLADTAGTGIADGYGWFWNSASGQWVVDAPPGASGGTQDSLGVDVDGNGTVDSYVFPAHIKKGANVTLTVAGDTLTIAGSLGLIDTVKTKDSVAYTSTLSGDTLIKISNNNALAQTRFRTDARQTGGVRWDNLAVLDANNSVLEISDVDAGINRSTIRIIGDDLYIGYTDFYGYVDAWHFYNGSLTSTEGAIIGSGIEWDGNRFDKNEIDSTGTFVVGNLYRTTSAGPIADSAYTTGRDVRVIVEDSLDNYVGSTAFNNAIDLLRTNIRDTIETAANPFTDFEVDSVRVTNIVASATVEVTGDTTGTITLTGVTAGYTTLTVADSGADNTIYLPLSSQNADTSKFLCLGFGQQTEWRDVPTSWDWSDSSSHGPDSVLYADTSAYAGVLDTAGAAFQKYVGDHGAGGFLDTLTDLDTIFATAEGAVKDLYILNGPEKTTITAADNDTLQMGVPGKARADSLQIMSFIEGSNGKYITKAMVDSIADASGRFSATGGSGSSDTLYIHNTADNDSISTVNNRLSIKAGSGITTTLAGDTATLAATLGTDITSAEIVDQTITKSDVDTTGANFVFDDAYRGTSGVADSAYATEYYARDAAGDSAASIQTGDVTDQTLTKSDIDTTGSNFVFDDAYRGTSGVADSAYATEAYVKLARLSIRDTVKVVPISRTIGLMDPKNFATDTVPLIHFDSTAFAGAVTLQRLEFSSTVAATDTIYLWEWPDAIGTGAHEVDTLILTAASSVISDSFHDNSFARGSWLVATKAKSGNSILMENITVTFIGGN